YACSDSMRCTACIPGHVGKPTEPFQPKPIFSLQHISLPASGIFLRPAAACCCSIPSRLSPSRGLTSVCQPGTVEVLQGRFLTGNILRFVPCHPRVGVIFSSILSSRIQRLFSLILCRRRFSRWCDV